MINCKKSYYLKLAKTIEKKLAQRNFDVIICDTVADAKDEALQLIQDDSTIGFGGSLTVEQTGIIETLHDEGFIVYDRNRAKGLQKDVMMRKSLTADYFLTSFNGISKDGDVVNIDNRGNRVAAITFGPEKVLAFVGINKVYGDLASTIETVRNFTAPLNVERLATKETPCQYTGQCQDCKSADCICNTIAIQRRSSTDHRITIFLILEDVGF